MNTSTVDQLVSSYLERLSRAAEALPADRRAELTAEIAEHIASARAAGAAADEAAVRTLLDRLGEPEEIVAAAIEDERGGYDGPDRGQGAAPMLVEVRPSTTLDSWAVAMLTVGSIVLVVGWLVGVCLLWTSRRWRWWEKLIGTLVVPLGPGIVLPLSLFSVGTESCSPAGCTTTGPPQWLMTALVAFIVVGPVVVGIYLFETSRRRADAEPPELRPVRQYAAVEGPRWGGLEISAVLTLGLGGFLIPLIGPIVGLALAWSSPRWTSQEKAVASVLAIGPVLLVVFAFMALMV